MIAIVGAGLAGMAAARRLENAGCQDYTILDRESRAGGRVDTRIIDGFRLDVGFHVASTGYPAFQRILPSFLLDPEWFDAGVLLQNGVGELVPFYHPLRHPRSAWDAGWPPFAAWDLFHFATLGLECLAGFGDVWAATHHGSAADLLSKRGFSDLCVESFWRPFFGGVFLDQDLQTSAGLLRYYLRAFILGRAFLPGGGIGRLASILREKIPDERFRFHANVREVEKGPDGFRVALDSGEILRAVSVILANGPVGVSQLLHWPEPEMRPTTTLYFKSRRALYPERCLVLPRAKDALVRHYVQLTNIDPGLAPKGSHLLSATVLNNQDLDDGTLFSLALREIGNLMPDAAGLLEPLHVTRVPAALPAQTPQRLASWLERRANLPPGLLLAGDLAGNASQNNALETGVAAAEKALWMTGRLT